jgi:hypothetical protein
MNIIKEIKALNLPNGEYLVFGSAPMGIHGIRNIHDIDILVSPNLYQQLKKRGWQEKKWKSSGSKYLAYKNIEAGSNWDYGIYHPTLESLLKTADIFDGIPFANLKEVIKWKMAFGRDKDKKDIQLIKTFLACKD